MQSRKIITIIIAAMLTLTAAAQDKRVKVACIGNSITEGYALADPSKDSYPAVLQQMLGNGYRVENFGLSGHTLLMKGNLPYMSAQRYKDALAFNPDIVTIKLGTNDSKPENWAHGDEFKRDLTALAKSFMEPAVAPQGVPLPARACRDGQVQHQRQRDNPRRDTMHQGGGRRTAAARNRPEHGHAPVLPRGLRRRRAPQRTGRACNSRMHILRTDGARL